MGLVAGVVLSCAAIGLLAVAVNDALTAQRDRPDSNRPDSDRPDSDGDAGGSDKTPDVGANEAQIALTNVRFVATDALEFHVLSLRGALRPARAGAPIDIDDIDDVILRVDAAEVRISGDVIPRVLRSLDDVRDLAKPRRVLAKVRGVRFEDGGAIVMIGAPVGRSVGSNRAVPSSLVISGGALRIGDMTMTGAVIELVDADDDGVALHATHLRDQLLASSARMTGDGARIFLVDPSDLEPRGRASRASRPLRAPRAVGR